MVLKRNSLPDHFFENGAIRRKISLGIANHLLSKKEDTKIDKKENEMRLERLGFNEKYFNNR